MKKYSCLIIDDEPLAISLIELHITKVSELIVKDKTTDAVEALNLLRTNAYDLIFLDIQMPEITGMELLSMVPDLKNVILTTAYRNYAVESYELEVLDYLVKPITLERFLKSVNRFLEINKNQRKKPDCIFVNVNKKLVKISFDEIIFIASQRDYIDIVTDTKTVSTRMKISDILKLLPTTGFIRIHQSYVINSSKITAIEQNGVEVNNQFLPVSRAYSGVVKNFFDVN